MTPGPITSSTATPSGIPGIPGVGQAVAVAFAIPAAGLDYWTRRLRTNGVTIDGPVARFDEEAIVFSDPCGLNLELVAGADTGDRPLWSAWDDAPVPTEYAIRGAHAVAVKETRVDPTGAFLTDTLGFRLVTEMEGRLRFQAGEGGSGALLDLLPQPGERRGRVAVGTVHHVAWRTPDSTEQERWRETIPARGVSLQAV